MPTYILHVLGLAVRHALARASVLVSSPDYSLSLPSVSFPANGRSGNDATRGLGTRALQRDDDRNVIIIMATVSLPCASLPDPLVLHLFVVGFHHHKGSTVEFAYPPLGGGSPSPEPQSLSKLLPPEWGDLPHLALPDGCHNYEEDSSFFTLPLPSDPQEPSVSPGRCVYGVSCCRQIDTKDLPQQGADVTRSTVQKSVCVLCRLPLFGFIESKLRPVTQAYFNSKDFSDVSILHETYRHLTASVSMETAASMLHLGLSPRDQVLCCQHRLLQVFKALLLQKRVIVYGSPVHRLCSSVLGIASLFPQCFEAWLDPHVGDEFGFPLKVLGVGAVQPYFCLQQMDSMAQAMKEGDAEHSWLLGGVANPLFEKQQQKVCDVFVNLGDGSVAIADHQLRPALRLTVADLRFCSLLTDEIQEEREGAQWPGSNRWVQAQFKHYTLSLLATSLNGDTLAVGDFNREFMALWLQSTVYLAWKKKAQQGKILRVDPQHVCQGELSVSDLRRRLVAQASDYGLLDAHHREQVTQIVERTQKVIVETAGRVSGALGGMWNAASSTVYSWWWTPNEEDADSDR